LQTARDVAKDAMEKKRAGPGSGIASKGRKVRDSGISDYDYLKNLNFSPKKKIAYPRGFCYFLFF
jgi:hypothetical protein